jgi:septal ring factor EnvC (AmiA/AmiB activator)
MKFAAAKIILFALLCSALPGRAQGIQVDMEEFRRLQGEVADLRDAKSADQRKISDLSRKVEQLQTALRSAEERTTIKLGDAITREDLKKVIDRISEVDERRESDRKIILEEFDKLAKALSKPAITESPRTRRQSTRDPEKETEKAPEPFEGTVYPHKVEPNQTVSEIIAWWNTSLKKEGLPTISYSQVKKANPNLDFNKIRVGQEILLPVPEKKR